MAEKSEKRRIFIYINGKEVENSLKSMSSEARRLRNEFAKTSDPFKKKKLAKELQRVEGKVKSLRNQAKGLGGTFGNLKKAVGSNLFTMVGYGAAITGIISVFKGAYKTISDFDESVADLAKTTNLSKDAARELAQEVIKINTRTSVTSLLELATAAGRLGLKGKDVVDFTREADKAFVSLGDSLEGDAGDIALTLGKLAGNFDLDKKYGVGDAINRIGSVMNDLGAKTKATEGPIIDFTKRLSGVATQANISLPDIAALGALFDESGQSIEIAATTMNKLLPAIGKDVERFAGIAGVSIKDFKELVEKDAMAALKLVAEGAQSNEEGLIGLTDTLESYGISNARAASIVGILSSKTERLTEIQIMANDAVEEGTSINNEFALKMGTMEAKSERLSKKWDTFIISLDGTESVIGNASRGFFDFFTDAITGLQNLDLIWKSTFSGLSDFSDKELSRTLSGGAWETEFGVSIDKITAEFDKIPFNKLRDNVDKVKDGWVELLGEDSQDAALLFNQYLRERIETEKGLKKTGEDLIKVKADSKNEDKSEEQLQSELDAEKKAAEEKNKIRKEAKDKQVNTEIKAKEKLDEKINELKEKAALSLLDEDEADLERIRSKYSVLLEEAKGHQDQIKEIEALRDEEIDIKEEEQKIIRIEKETALLEEKQAFEDEVELMRLEGLAKELADVDAKYEALYAKADQYEISTATLQKQHQKEIEKITFAHNKKLAEDDTKLKDIKNQNAEMILGNASDLASNLSTLAEEGSRSQKNLAKTAAVISGAQAVMQILAAQYTGIGFIDVALKAAAITGVVIKTKQQISKIEGAGMAKGGYTGDGFGTPDESGYKVAGYVHQDEWVAPEWMTKSPMYADTIGMLETARQSKSGYASGGPVSVAGNIDDVAGSVSSSTAGLELAINTLNQHLENGIKSKTVIDQNNLIDLKEGIDEISKIEV